MVEDLMMTRRGDTITMLRVPRAARILVGIYPLFLPLERSNSISLRQNPFKLSEVSDSSKIAREPTPFGQENSHSRDI